MKKVMAYVLVGGLMLTSMVGCGKKATPENLIADLNKNYREITSMVAEVNANMMFGEGDAGVGLNLSMDLKQTLDPNVSHVKMAIDVEMFGEKNTVETEMYQFLEDDKQFIYSKDIESGEWSYEEETDIPAIDSSMLEIVKKVEDSFVLEEDTKPFGGRECFILDGYVSVKDLVSLSDNPMFGDFNLGDSFDIEALTDEKIDMELWIYRDEILPAYISWDLTELVASSEESIDEVEFDISFKSYNEIDKIPVPPEIEDMKNSGSNKKSENKKVEDKKAEDKKTEAIEALGANWNTTMVQIDDTLITLPCAISDLQKTGFELEQEYAMEEGPIESGDFGYSYFIDENENQILVELYNDGEQPQEMAACKVGGIHVTGDEIDASQVGVVFPGGVRIGMDIEEVRTLYGAEFEKEEQDEYLVYTWFEQADNYKACEIMVDAETGVIEQMGMQNTLY